MFVFVSYVFFQNCSELYDVGVLAYIGNIGNNEHYDKHIETYEAKMRNLQTCEIHTQKYKMVTT